MPDAKSVAIVIGSLRQQSFSRKLATILAQKLSGPYSGRIVEIGDLPLYNEDLEKDEPASYARFRSNIRASEAVLFVTPEYNRSIPAPLKNALDVGSRPMKASVWNGKPAAIVSLSRGALGGFGAHHHLRQSMVGVNMLPLTHPEIYLGGIATLLGDDGTITNPAVEKLLDDMLVKFGEWIALLSASSLRD